MSDRDRDSNGPFGAPRAVAGFRLLRKIGEGGMSAVYQSYDVARDRPVAVKLLADHLAGQPEFVGRFYREARLSRVLEHANVVQGHASGFDSDVQKHYLVLEFIDGPTAHGALTRLGRLPVGVVVRLGVDIASALAFLHERQYVHRDVKPDNILLHPAGVAKLADLGLAKRLNDDSQLTSVHQGVGTSYYMPYEQAVNANLVDGRSDIFALGATLYHLLTGEVPFAGATHDEIVREKWGGSFRRLREANPDVPAELAELVEATLACDPRARIQHAAQLARALAATGLAEALPSFAHDEDDAPSDRSAPPSDMPTRADYRIPLTSPGDVTATPPPVSPPDGEGFVPGTPAATPPPPGVPPEPPRRTGGWPWFVGAGCVVAALVAQHFFRFEPAPQPEAVPAVVQDEPKLPGGLDPASCQ